MGVLYETKGAAKEYAELAVNLYDGCAHGCTYCYAPACLRKSPRDFAEAKPKKDIVERLKKEVAKKKGNGEIVLLCFTCDPYQPIEETFGLTRLAIPILGEAGYRVAVLTKAPSRALRLDGKLFKDYNVLFGTTLTGAPTSIEPNSEMYRLQILQDAKRAGLKTWASFEPVIDIAETLRNIKQVCEEKIADKIMIGRWNHNQKTNRMDWRGFASDVQKILTKHPKQKYYIKTALQKYGVINAGKEGIWEVRDGKD